MKLYGVYFARASPCPDTQAIWIHKETEALLDLDKRIQPIPSVFPDKVVWDKTMFHAMASDTSDTHIKPRFIRLSLKKEPYASFTHGILFHSSNKAKGATGVSIVNLVNCIQTREWFEQLISLFNKSLDTMVNHTRDHKDILPPDYRLVLNGHTNYIRCCMSKLVYDREQQTLSTAYHVCDQCLVNRDTVLAEHCSMFTCCATKNIHPPHQVAARQLPQILSQRSQRTTQHRQQ